jgi:hypothetical protein
MTPTLPLPRLRPRTLQDGTARDSLLPAFKPIGISSVAAAAAQVKPEPKPEDRAVEIPLASRHDWAA